MDRDLAPPLLKHCEKGTWHIELFGGGGVSKDFNHFEDDISPADLAKLMAAFHATPTEWFEPFRAQVLEQWPQLKAANLPPEAPFWVGPRSLPTSVTRDRDPQIRSDLHTRPSIHTRYSAGR